MVLSVLRSLSVQVSNTYVNNIPKSATYGRLTHQWKQDSLSETNEDARQIRFAYIHAFFCFVLDFFVSFLPARLPRCRVSSRPFPNRIPRSPRSRSRCPSHGTPGSTAGPTHRDRDRETCRERQKGREGARERRHDDANRLLSRGHSHQSLEENQKSVLKPNFHPCFGITEYCDTPFAHP